ncbi:hypothetical protein A5482_009135 [Cyanobacterium sp. IPPAS B-1200]|uniref:hypothetical protein n=1 Tax=Cyanobacterium sp. IPPAS B-1200 TaxID=1562720 RepID=UPI000852596E|nr:hypothetical protein [Cyanobacterium sp. IPPAS B-1200]OEJ77460.1 hypothetical protein A5482_06060 [Cyanobacterium sp. IPPAS B-1200]
MHKYITLCSQILFYNLLALLLFGKSTLAQSPEYRDIEECTVTDNTHDKSLFSVFPSGANGCQFEEEITHDSGTYQLKFDVGNNKNNSRIEVLDSQGRNHTVTIDEFIGISTSITVSLLPFYNQENPSLLIDYVTYGNGFNNCTVNNMIVFDENIPSGAIRINSTNLNVSEVDRQNPHSFNACFNFEDINNDGILEAVAFDSRFGYQFSSGAASAAPTRIMSFTPTGLEDVTQQNPSHLRQQAESLWNTVIQRSGEENVEYFGYMAAYAGVKSLLGEYQSAKSLIQRRMEIDNTATGYFSNDFITNLETFLRNNGYSL